MSNVNSTKDIFHILVIDDNKDIQEDYIKILVKESDPEFDNLSEQLFGKSDANDSLPNIDIDTASQGQDAFQLVQENLKKDKRYALAFVDIRMPPGWDGVETIKNIWSIDSNIRMVICSAYCDYTQEEIISELGDTGKLMIIRKPFDSQLILDITNELTKKWQLTKTE